MPVCVTHCLKRTDDKDKLKDEVYHFKGKELDITKKYNEKMIKNT